MAEEAKPAVISYGGLTPEEVRKLVEAVAAGADEKVAEVSGQLGMAREAMRTMLSAFGKADIPDEKLPEALAEFVEQTHKANSEVAEQFHWAQPAEKTPAEELLTPPRKLRAFLCHAKEDKPKVLDLYYKLKDSNVDPWIDIYNIIPGQRWEEEIEKSIRSTDAVLVCLTNASTSKTGYVQAEIKRALDIADRQPEGKIFIIPVRLEDCQVPLRLRDIQYVDYFGTDGHNILLTALRYLSGWLNQNGNVILEVSSEEKPNAPPEEAVKAILSQCYRRALFTRTHAQMDIKLMFASIRECQAIVLLKIPEIHRKALQDTAVQLHATLYEIERLTLGQWQPNDVDQLKLAALHLFRVLADETGGQYPLPETGKLGEAVYFTKQEADAPLSFDDLNHQTQVRPTTGAAGTMQKS